MHEPSRRDFIKTTLAGAAGAATLSAAAPAAQPVEGPIRLGIVGAGIRGLELMQAALNAGGKIIAVCDLYDHQFRRSLCHQPRTWKMAK